MKTNRWLILFIIIFISSILLFVLSDRTKAPKMVHETNLTWLDDRGNEIGIWNKTGTNNTYPLCEEDYVYIQEKNICYNENPLGHTIVTFPQILATIFTIVLITIYEFKDWRTHLSSKILPYQNKYEEELRVIPKSPDIFEQKGIVWVRGGYDALISSSDENIYIARKEDTARIGNNLILKGALQKVTPQYLYQYLKNDEHLLKEILNNPILKLNKRGKLEETGASNIYLTIPLINNEKIAFTSIKGNYGFGSDRFKLVITALFKMRQGLSGFSYKLTKANEKMLDDARKMSESTANIADAVTKTQKAEIETYRHTEPSQGGQYEQQRKNI